MVSGKSSGSVVQPLQGWVIGMTQYGSSLFDLDHHDLLPRISYGAIYVQSFFRIVRVEIIRCCVTIVMIMYTGVL